MGYRQDIGARLVLVGGLVLWMALFPLALPAAAREMDMADWTNVDGFSLWRSMNHQDQADAIRDFVSKNPQATKYGDAYVSRVQKCLNKEVNDPEYKGVRVPLLVPLSYCIGKYMAILTQKKG